MLAVSPTVYAQTNERSSSIVTIEGQGYYVHTVRKGETKYGLSKLYEVSVADIDKANPQAADGLQEGQVIKVPTVQEPVEKLSARKQKKTFDTHTVNQGETLYSISRRYEIPVNTILEDNPGLDPANLALGQKINIRKKSIGDATPQQITEQMEEYRDAVNSVMDDAQYHLVEKGETLYAIGVMYDVTPEQVKEANGGLQDGLKAGAMIKIPVKAEVVIKPEEPVDVEDTVATTSDAYVKSLAGKEVVNVALMLPLKEDGKSSGNRQFLEFYRGALLALEDLKAQGVSVRATLYNTSRSADDVRRIVKDPTFAATDLIVGPVYEDNIKPAIAFAEEHNIAIVSPLAAMEKVASPVLYQAAPAPDAKYDKLKELIAGDKNIVYISTPHKDNEIEAKVRPLLPQGTRVVEFSNIKSVPFRDYISRTKDNVFIVSCTDMLTLDKLLASIGSMQSNIVSRGMGNPKMHVFGSSSWAQNSTRKSEVDLNLYFRLGVCYVASYHADRSNAQVSDFFTRYLNAYKAMPSPMSHRAYDVVKLFVYSAVKGTGADYMGKLNNSEIALLQVPYKFERRESGSVVNTDWPFVFYNDDYTIEVK